MVENKMIKMMVVMGCNSGGVLEEEQGKGKFLQSLVNVSNEFLNVFTSFGEMVGSVLGLNVNSKKSDIGKYFKTVQGTVQGTKDELEKIVAEMKEGKNPNVAGVEIEVKKLVTETFDKIIEGAKEASEAIGVGGVELLGNVAAQNNAGVAGTDIEKLVRGIKGIVDVVLKGVGNPEAGNDKKAEDGSTARSNGNAVDGEAAKLFVIGAGGAGEEANAKKVVTDAAKAVGAVTGADILQAMIKDNGKSAKLAENNDANANVSVSPKDAVVAGGIVLRAMAKGGKFANSNNADVSDAVKGVAVSAVMKALDTLTISIRKTMDLGLKNVKEAMKIQANTIPFVSDKDTFGAKNQ
ncbi:variable large family protein [Borrelia crocidurae]|nr:variable large family protein [Borrelia crocidurae]